MLGGLVRYRRIYLCLGFSILTRSQSMILMRSVLNLRVDTHLQGRHRLIITQDQLGIIDILVDEECDEEFDEIFDGEVGEQFDEEVYEEIDKIKGVKRGEKEGDDGDGDEDEYKDGSHLD